MITIGDIHWRLPNSKVNGKPADGDHMTLHLMVMQGLPNDHNGTAGIVIVSHRIHVMMYFITDGIFSPKYCC